MKWDEVSKDIEKLWSKEERTDDGSYFHDYVNDAVNKKEKFIESVNKFGSPQYILDEEILRKRCKRFIDIFKEKLPNSEFFYAFKSNDLPYLIKKVKEEGFHADVAGLFELKLALKLGFEKIIFTAPAKDEEELKLALENNDKVILNIDNEDELLRLIEMIGKEKVNISFRLNPDTSVTKSWSKFGFNLDELKQTVEKIKEAPQLNWVGLQFHCSWNTSAERYVKNIELIGKYLKENLAEESSKLEFIDIGGGFVSEGNAYLSKDSFKGIVIDAMKEEDVKIDFELEKPVVEEVDELEKYADEIKKALEEYIFSLNSKIKIYFEPGRYISRIPTTILLKVSALKGENVIVDGGINLIGDYRFKEYEYSVIVDLSRPSLNLKKRVIYGPLCDPSDLWGYSYFGEDVKKGDILAVLHQGSYTFSCAWRFIRPVAPYISLGLNGELTKIKEKEAFEDRYKGCLF